MSTIKVYWDLEISFPDGVPNQEFENIWEAWPFGVSIAATLEDGSITGNPLRLWYDNKDGQPCLQWDKHTVKLFLMYLMGARARGWKIFTWNGTGFDYQLLAKLLPEWHAHIVHLSRHSYDPCFQALCLAGFPVGLEACAIANKSKAKELEGANAPAAWAEGSYDLVKQYVTGDVERLKDIVDSVSLHKGLKWRPRKKGVRLLPFEKGFLTVGQCLKLPEPDTSWMKPKEGEDEVKRTTRQEVIDWWTK